MLFLILSHHIVPNTLIRRVETFQVSLSCQQLKQSRGKSTLCFSLFLFFFSFFKFLTSGYECYSADSDLPKLNKHNTGKRPMLVLMAHDGDNAFGGGYTYYMQCVQNFARQATNLGFNPTTIQTYLDQFPVPHDDFVKVEDGAWVNADGDFGAPQFLNWNWP